jgi:hemophore-related protein
MFTPWLTRLAAAITGLALVLNAGTSVASADPDLGPVINTTCTYSQVVSALNAQVPAAAAQLNGSPSSQAALRGFLDSSPDQRQQILEELEGRYPQSQQYIPLYAGFAVQVANTCNNY